MSSELIWCAAAVLVGAGIAVDAYLAITFIRDWRRGRAGERSRRRPVREKARPNRPRREYTYGPSTALAALALTAAGAGTAGAQDQGEAPAPDTVQEAPIGSAISVQLNIDYTTAYFYRGIIQEDSGLIVQPAARVTAHLYDSGGFKLDGFIGAWNSFQGQKTGSDSEGDFTEYWYEADVYAGLTATSGTLALTTSYTFLTSPNDAFQTVQELGFTLALDNSEWLGAWSLKPYATLAIETGADASDGADSDTGIYLEFGIAPGLAFELWQAPITLTFPASIGMSLSDYYQDSTGEDDTFGFAQVGVKASLPLGTPGRFGAWTLSAGVSVLLLGDHAADDNTGDDAEVIGTVGLQWNF